MNKQRLSTQESSPQHSPRNASTDNVNPLNKGSSEETQYAQDQYYESNVSEWVISIYAYEGQNETELSFKEGEWIGILEDYGDGWGRGLHQLSNKTGVFPMNYTQKSETQGQLNQDAQMQKKRDIRDKLKEEMKDLKEGQIKQQQRREILEKEISQLTESSQKLKKELRHLKADLSDKNSIVSDLIKLTYALDYHVDSTFSISKSSATPEYCEAISHFNSEFQKESKNSSGMIPFAQKTCPKLKELAELVQSFQFQSEESFKLAKDLRPELELFTKVVESKLAKK